MKARLYDDRIELESENDSETVLLRFLKGSFLRVGHGSYGTIDRDSVALHLPSQISLNITEGNDKK